jgi:hypothetical protein
MKFSVKEQTLSWKQKSCDLFLFYHLPVMNLHAKASKLKVRYWLLFLKNNDDTPPSEAHILRSSQL